MCVLIGYKLICYARSTLANRKQVLGNISQKKEKVIRKFVGRDVAVEQNILVFV